MGHPQTDRTVAVARFAATFKLVDALAAPAALATVEDEEPAPAGLDSALAPAADPTAKRDASLSGRP